MEQAWNINGILTIEDLVNKVLERNKYGTPLEQARQKFNIARDSMPEWIAYEKAKREWINLNDAEKRKAYDKALNEYSFACERLLEWQTYCEKMMGKTGSQKMAENIGVQQFVPRLF